jgi:hypothetical protein
MDIRNFKLRGWMTLSGVWGNAEETQMLRARPSSMRGLGSLGGAYEGEEKEWS